MKRVEGDDVLERLRGIVVVRISPPDATEIRCRGCKRLGADVQGGVGSNQAQHALWRAPPDSWTVSHAEGLSC
jgi:hypothetical protein